MQISALFKILGPVIPFEAVTILNISADGIGFLSPKKLPKGTLLKIDMELPERETVSLKVEVMWSDQTSSDGNFKVGVFILDSSTRNEEKFIKFYCLQMLKNVRKNIETPDKA